MSDDLKLCDRCYTCNKCLCNVQCRDCKKKVERDRLTNDLYIGFMGMAAGTIATTLIFVIGFLTEKKK